MAWNLFAQFLIILIFGIFGVVAGFVLGKRAYRDGSRDKYIQEEKIDPESMKIKPSGPGNDRFAKLFKQDREIEEEANAKAEEPNNYDQL